MSLKRSSVIESEIVYNVRIKCIDNNLKILDLNTEEDIHSKLKSMIICITPYYIKNNIMTYFDHKDVEQRVKVEMSEDVNNLVAPTYNTEDFLFVQDYQTFEDFINEFKFNMSQKTFSNSVDLEFYIDFANELPFFLDQNFMEFIFKYFTGNIILYGNNKTIWELPNGEINIESLKIERGEVRLNNIVNFRLDYFELLHLQLMGKNINYQSPDQLVFYSKDSSIIRYCSLENCIQIGISGEVETQYKWLNATLDIYSLDINFNTDADKVGKFDHIIKIDNYANLNLTNININKRLTKMVPFKIERTPNINLINYNNLLRPKDKGTIELSISNVTDLTINNFTVISEDINQKETAAISISKVENGDSFSFNNIYIENLNFLSLSNINALSLDIDNLYINSNHSPLNMISDIFIDDFNIMGSKILANNLNIANLKKIYIDSTYIKSKENIDFSITNITLNDTELVALKDINLTSTGFSLNEELEGKVSLRNSAITATNNLNITTDREEGRSIIDNTLIKAKNLVDKGFLYSSIQNNSELIVSTFEGSSSEYTLKDCVFNNKYIHKSEKAYQFKGLVQGSCSIKNEDTNQKFSMLLYQESMEPFTRKDLTITFNDNMTNNDLNFRIDLENICQNILYKSVSNAKVNVEIYIKDNSSEKHFYTTGIYQYKEKDNNLLNLYLKNSTIEDMKNTITNDGTMEEDNEKLNFGIQPST